MKKAINKMKKPSTELEKIFAKDLSDKGLISKTHKEHIQFNIQKTNNSIKQWQRMNRHFSKEDIRGQQTNEEMLNITNHQGNANQNHNEISPHTCKNGYHQRQQITGVGKDVEKREFLCTVGGNVNWCSH